MKDHKAVLKTSVGQVVSKITVTIDGVTIPVVPISIAAKRLGYTSRYVQNLCEWEKLIAIKILGLWFIPEREIDLFRQNVSVKDAV